MMFASLLAGAEAGHAKRPPPLCPAVSIPVEQPRLEGRLRVRFLGTSSLLFDDGQTQILFDGYFSRPPLLESRFDWVRPNCIRIKQGLEQAGVTSLLKAVFVAHSHIDHVLDAPMIARLTGAELIGSASVLQVAEGHGLTGRVHDTSQEAPFEYGAFKVKAFRTPHSQPNTAYGRIEASVPLYAWAGRYRADSSDAFLIEHRGRRILVYPSSESEAGLLKKKEVTADIIFLGIHGLGRKGRSKTDSYWADVVHEAGGRLVFPVHWDNIGYPLTRTLRPFRWPLDDVALTRKRLADLARECAAVEELTPFEPVDLEERFATLRARPPCPPPLPR